MKEHKPGKKKYEKPVITTEKIFETAALACGKCTTGNPSSQAGCSSLKKFS